MPALTRLLVLLATALTAPSLAAQEREHRAVLAVVQRFFDAMAARDTAAAAATIVPDGLVFPALGSTEAPTPPRTLGEWLAGLAADTTGLLERMWDPVVLVRRDLATIWARYDFHVNGRFRHCGADAFTLLRRGGQWKISGIAYTVERDDCAPSPLGPVEGLVLSYDMETATGDGRLRDRSGGERHGRVRRTERVPGVRGAARRFRTVEDRVQVPEDQALDLDGPLTIAAWVRVDSLGIHQHVVACDDKWALWITPDDRWRLGDTRGGGWSSTAGSVRRGEWTAVAAVLRGRRGDALEPGVVTLYVNGKVAPAERHLRTEDARAAGTWSPGPLHRADACYVGFESHQDIPSHRTLSFVGAIDELRVYARALEDAEVEALAQRPGGAERQQ